MATAAVASATAVPRAIMRVRRILAGPPWVMF
jgi:hypothetical protein